MKKKIDDYMNKIYPYIVSPYMADGEMHGFVARYIDIPAIEVFGDTEEEVIKELHNAKLEWFTEAVDAGVAIPEPSGKTDAGFASGNLAQAR